MRPTLLFWAKTKKETCWQKGRKQRQGEPVSVPTLWNPSELTNFSLSEWHCKCIFLPASSWVRNLRYWQLWSPDPNYGSFLSVSVSYELLKPVKFHLPFGPYFLCARFSNKCELRAEYALSSRQGPQNYTCKSSTLSWGLPWRSSGISHRWTVWLLEV